jgi:hypothetical protein
MLRGCFRYARVPMPSRSSLIAPLVFLIGCAVGGAASHFAVPPARAQTITKWEYYCFPEEDTDEITTMANKAGLQGWEMVGSSSNAQYHSGSWCFKRPR